MVDFNYGLYSADVSRYATFLPGSHMAQNNKGYLLGYATVSDVNALSRVVVDFAPIGSSLGSGASRVYTSNQDSLLSINPPLVAAWNTGEFFAVYSDYAQNVLWVIVWPDIEQAFTPTIRMITGTGCGMGKYQLLADEARRRLFVVGSSGYLFCLYHDGTEQYRRKIFTGGSGGANYFGLDISNNGEISLITNTAVWDSVNNKPRYDTIGYTNIVNPLDNPPVIATAAWPFSSSVKLPFDAAMGGDAAWINAGETQRLDDNLFIDVLVNDPNLYVLYARTSTPWARMFAQNDLKHVQIALASRARTFNGHALSASVRRMLFGEEYHLKGASGSLIKRKGNIYVLSTMTDATRKWYLVALKIDDDGLPQFYSKTEVPAAEGYLLHYMNASRGKDWYDKIEGLFLHEKSSPSQWASGEVIPTADMYWWTLNTP